jgi:hypothetical protein
VTAEKARYSKLTQDGHSSDWFVCQLADEDEDEPVITEQPIEVDTNYRWSQVCYPSRCLLILSVSLQLTFDQIWQEYMAFIWNYSKSSPSSLSVSHSMLIGSSPFPFQSLSLAIQAKPLPGPFDFPLQPNTWTSTTCSTDASGRRQTRSRASIL